MIKVDDRVEIVRMAGMRFIGRPNRGDTGTVIDITENMPVSAYNGTAFVRFDDGCNVRVPVAALKLCAEEPDAALAAAQPEPDYFVLAVDLAREQARAMIKGV